MIAGSACPPHVRRSPQPGDVVRLNTGGAEMTVLRVLDGGMVKCAWFEFGPHVYSEVFVLRQRQWPQASLEIVR